MSLALLVISLLQSGALPTEWVQITKNQIESNKVVKVDAKSLRLEKCREVKLASNGLDIITDSSFTTVVAIVVDRSGEVQRFRIVRRPKIEVDVSEPIVDLAAWRYRAAPPTLAGPAFEIAVAFPKPFGADETTACRSR